mgnify:CR=1 FL=1|jgi:hypothetical protein
MDEAETSIEQLTDNRESTENSSIIDEILSEINKSVPQGEVQEQEQPQPNITLNEETALSQHQQIPEQMPQQIPEQMPQQIPEQMLQPISEQISPQNYSNEPEELKNTIDLTTDTLGYLKDNILEELKLPSVVLVLFIILSSSKIDSLFIKTHSNFFVDSVGNITFPSIFIKAILAALIFYLFKLFI